MAEKDFSFFEMLQNAVGEYMKGVYTAIPGSVIAFDPPTQLAQIQIGIQRVDIDGKAVTPPPIIDCPVFFAGDGYVMETQIDPGCEGLIVFSQRCIDGWVNTGGCAVNPLSRFHDMADALFIPGFRPMTKVVSNFSNNGIKLRNKAGTQFCHLKNDGSIFIENDKGHIRIDAAGNVTINGVKFDTAGNVTTPTTVTAKTVIGSSDVKFGGISGKGHVHPCGDHDTGAPK